MEIAKLVATRSTCLRRKVGAVIVKDRHILSTGYNGTPKGITHCEVVGCLREKLKVPTGERHELCRGLHAEQIASGSFIRDKFKRSNLILHKSALYYLC